MKKMVVMGGSYNPPTRAHYALIEKAMDAVHADKGVFVPTAHEYVFKKLKRQRCPWDVISEEVRLQMLESFCKNDQRLSVSRIQMLRKVPGDYETLVQLQEEFPDTEIYFVTGSDKLYVLPRWKSADKLIKEFRILVARRGEDDLDKIREIRPFINENWERFTAFDVPAELSDISSSEFRRRLHEGDESAKELVTEEVWALMNKNGKIPWNTISDFHEEAYAFLSNFFEATVEYKRLTYRNSEAAFQAQKCMTEEEKLPFTEYTPQEQRHGQARCTSDLKWEMQLSAGAVLSRINA